MSLSTLRRSMLLVGFCMMLQACHSCKTAEVTTVSGPTATPATLPFSIVEPQVYQAYIVTSGGGLEEKTFVARKNDKYRLDVFQDQKNTMTEIIAGSRFVIDHRTHTFYEEPAGTGPSNLVSPAES